MMKGVEKQIQPRIIIMLEKMFLLGVTGTCDDCTVTAASQEPCYRL